MLDHIQNATRIPSLALEKCWAQKEIEGRAFGVGLLKTSANQRDLECQVSDEEQD
jgi:hypothetical protein